MRAIALPPYEELRRLVVDEGRSYPQLAREFDCSTNVVYRALRRGVRENGEQWPLLTTKDRIDRISRAYADKQHWNPKLPSYEVLRRLYVTEGFSQYQLGRIFRVDQKVISDNLRREAARRGEWPLKTREQAERDRARRIRSEGSVSVDFIWEDCLEKFAELGITQQIDMAKETGLSESFFSYLARGERTHMRRSSALRLLEWLGEEAHPRLRGEIGVECGCGNPIPIPPRGRPSQFCSVECYEHFMGKKYQSGGNKGRNVLPATRFRDDEDYAA